MENIGFLDSLPLWFFFVIVLLLSLFSVEAGYRLGKRRHTRQKEETDAPVGGMVGAVLGLLALIIAFTFGFGAERFEARRQMVLNEANAIGTTYLRAGMLPEQREEIQNLLKEYVDVRLQGVLGNNLVEGMRRSNEIQNQLWAHAVSIGEKNPNSIVVGLFIQSLNETIDLHSNRLQFGIRNRVPAAIWFVLIAVAIASLGAMGYHAGLAGVSRTLAGVAVAFAFSAVIGLIADLDRPQQGVLKVGQHALLDLQRSMNAPAPPR